MILGINGAEEATHSIALLSGDLSLTGQYGSGTGAERGYGLPTDYFVVSGYDEEEHLPGGIYTLKNWGNVTATASAGLVLSAGQAGSIANPRNLTITGPEAHLVSVYMPGVEVPSSRHHFTPNPLYAEALKPFGAYRFTPQLVNGSTATTWQDRRDGLADYTNPYRATDVMGAFPGIKIWWCSLPHLWTIERCQEWLLRVAEFAPADVTIQVERSNELWNNSSGFSQGRWVLENWGDRAAVDNNEWRTRYRAAGLFQAELALAVKELDDPRFRTVLASQTDNPWVTTEQIGAIKKAHGNLDMFYSLAVGGYVQDGQPLNDTEDITAYWDRGLARLDDRLATARGIADKYDLRLDLYESNSHLTPPYDPAVGKHVRVKELQEWHREAAMQQRFSEMLYVHNCWLESDAVNMLYRLASQPHAMDFGLRNNILPGTTSPRYQAVLEWAAHGVEPDPEPQPEPVDVRDVDGDGMFTLGDVQISQAFGLQCGNVHLNDPSMRAEIERIAAMSPKPKLEGGAK